MSQDNFAIARLRARLGSDRPAIAMAAHNPLAAKLAAEAGCDAIWGSISRWFHLPSPGLRPGSDTHPPQELSNGIIVPLKLTATHRSLPIP